MRKSLAILLYIFVFAALIIVPSHTDIIFSSGEWDFGTIEVRDPQTLSQMLSIENGDDEALEVEIVDTCPCLSVEPKQATIQPGQTGFFTLSYDASDDEGPVERYFVIRTNRENLEKALYAVHGTVTRKSRESAKTERPRERVVQPGSANRITVTYYFLPGCRYCQRFLEKTIPELEKKLGVEINVVDRSILDPESYREYLGKLAELGEKERSYPALVVGRTVIQGETEISQRLEQELRQIVENQGTDKSVREEDAKPAEDTAKPAGRPAKPAVPLARNLAIIPVLAAGLLDGINPCAFTTIIFLLTALALAGKRRREILTMGLFFTLSVFATYFLVGLGLFEAIRLTTTFPVVARVLRWALISVLIFFAGLSLYDYYLIRKGRASEMTLQLPDFFKKRIRETIKSRARSAALVATSLVLGFLVSLFELACTGQVYFPFLVFIVRNEKKLSGFLFLLLYNLGFILPLLAVFFVTYRGVSSRRLTELFQNHMGKVKIGLSAVFILMAVLTIIT